MYVQAPLNVRLSHRQRILVLDKEGIGHTPVAIVVDDGGKVQRQQRKGLC